MSNEIKTTGNAEDVFKNTEFNRFGLISAILLIVGCLGGLTIGMGAIEHVWMITLVIIPTMTTLSLLLAVAPMKYIISAGTAAVIIDLLFISYFLIA
ncbi:MAG: hypothetical protein ACPGVI_01505 [Crocinitomicaceae bacterium]